MLAQLHRICSSGSIPECHIVRCYANICENNKNHSVRYF
uniref:Uncharacterized protein n=1 Tax=Arundo donax TaxID=35708 RepID=A0A0A8ZFA5_ARUDO